VRRQSEGGDGALDETQNSVRRCAKSKAVSPLRSATALQILARLIKRTIDQSVMPKHSPRATEVYQRYFFRFSGLKAHGGAGRNVQSHPSRRLPIEHESAINLKKVIVAADLNWPITRVFHQNGCDATSGVRFDLSRFDEVFAWVHCVVFHPQISQIMQIKKLNH